VKLCLRSLVPLLREMLHLSEGKKRPESRANVTAISEPNA
jgi:hypothetical protein